MGGWATEGGGGVGGVGWGGVGWGGVGGHRCGEGGVNRCACYGRTAAVGDFLGPYLRYALPPGRILGFLFASHITAGDHFWVRFASRVTQPMN